MEEVRPATPSDGPDLDRLLAEAHAAVYGQRGGSLWLRRGPYGIDPGDALSDLVGRPGHLVLVGTTLGATVAFAVAHRQAAPEGRALAVIDGLYTEEAGRDLGLGEMLVEAVLEWARSEGCEGVDAVALPGDRTTKNLFERCGLTARAIVVHRSLRS